MDYKKLIETNFNIKISKLSFCESHFGTEIYLAETSDKKFVVKKLPSYMTDVVNESGVTDYLRTKGINTPVLLKTKLNKGVLQCDDFLITVQSFIEGNTLKINSASKEFLNSSAELLGKINLSFKAYKGLPLRFGSDFFDKKTAINKCNDYEDEYQKSQSVFSESIVDNWKSQIKHLEKISSFDIDTTKLTYSNSHGDYNLCQIVVNDNQLTVVDWSSACKLPVCLEVITSYAFANPKSINGSIDVAELKEYIERYSKHFQLNDYDLKMMPYVLYFWHTMCNYHPSEQIADNYKSIAILINNLLNWLFENVDKLSEYLYN